MVFYFKARPEAGDYTIFMGLDKYENEELIKYGFPEDVWFHVDKMSSAHVYLRLNKGQTIDDIPEGVLEDCAQLVKANSIQGNFPLSSIDLSHIFVSAEREAVNAAERAERKQQLRDKKRREELEKLEKERQAELRSYKNLMVAEKMTSNKDIASANKSLQELEEDFM
ncbi:UNVERIFIED_CONTAM: Coiled-coil domain-containing protein 25 [Sesamum angustifolium]|uniref:Coiled-coil domain-containing protein 25 n=1 Tax=Sesamum angustifolium TaxID=2727405 RepID=A0AAW2MIT6_9LAMI